MPLTPEQKREIYNMVSEYASHFIFNQLEENNKRLKFLEIEQPKILDHLKEHEKKLQLLEEIKQPKSEGGRKKSRKHKKRKSKKSRKHRKKTKSHYRR